MSSNKLTIFIVSDGTGITAETITLSVTNCFEFNYELIRFLFIDSLDKAYQTASQINKRIDKKFGNNFIIIATINNPNVKQYLQKNCKCKIFNPISSIIDEVSLYTKTTPSLKIGRFAKTVNTESYHDRMEAINYTINHDDGQTFDNFSLANIIIIGVSRSAKTPTSIYLSMQYGLKVANYPLTPDDFNKMSLPLELLKYKQNIFGLSIDPKRLSEIRNERMPNSKYASLENCKYEVAKAEQLMNLHNITCISSTNKSIEEISALIMQKYSKNNSI